MAKKAYIGVDGTARKIKKGYIGIDDIAHRIKKAYVGIGGVARPCWPTGELTYYGVIDPLTRHATYSAAEVADYAIFKGAVMTSAAAAAYGKSLTKLDLGSETLAAEWHAGMRAGEYALLVPNVTTVTAYDNALTKSTVSRRSSNRYPNATELGSYGFVNGENGVVDVFDASLTRHFADNLTGGDMTLMGCANNGVYAIFAAGYSYSPSGLKQNVQAYDMSLTRIDAPSLAEKNNALGAARAGNHCVVAGGRPGTGNGNEYSKAYAYDASLTQTVISSLSIAKQTYNGAGDFDEFAIFAGGYKNSDAVATVDVYDSALTHTVATPLSAARTEVGMATVGDYCLAGGGYDKNSEKNIVDVYTLM